MPAVLEPSPSARATSGPAIERPFHRRLLISTARLCIVAAIAASLASAWYFAHRGLDRWRQVVVDELHRRGVEATVGHLTINPFRGLVAEEVRIYDYKHREKTVALISEVCLDLNYAALFHHQPFINALDIRDAEMSLPMSGLKAPSAPAELTKFRARIYFPPEQIYVAQAEGIFCGVRISTNGQLIQRQNAPPSSPLSEEEWTKRLALVQRLTNELQKFKFPVHPTLQIKFSGDLAELENAQVEATMRADKAVRGSYEMHDLSAVAEFNHQLLTLSRCQWSDAAGTFSATGSWARQTNEASFQARSDLDLKGFLEAFGLGQAVSEFKFQKPPVLVISGQASFGSGQPKVQVLGNIGASSFVYRSVPFSQLNASFSWDGERTLLRDVHVQNQGGQLQAELLDAPNDFRLDIDSSINPIALRAFVSPELQQFLTEWEWPRPPVVHLAVRAPDHNPASWRGEGSIALERARFRGAWMNNASARVRFGDGAVTYDNIRLTRPEGTGTGSFTYDFRRHEVRIANVKTTLNPSEVINWIDPKMLKTVTPYKFRGPPVVTTNGIYRFDGAKGTKLELTVDSTGGMDYVFLGKTLPFAKIGGRLTFTDDRLQITDLKGDLFAGRVQGNADISLAPNDSKYRATVSLAHVDFPTLTNLYFDYKTVHGELKGAYDFTGVGSEARTMKGTGTLEVTNGDVFAIPIFGPLSGLFNAVLPGKMGYSIARKANGDFTVKDGIIHTDNFEAAGNLFSMVGHGDIHFLDDKLDFYMRMKANGPGVLLSPVYKLFEYVGEGSLKKPDWHPANF